MRSHRKKRLDKALIAFVFISVSSLASAKMPQQQANGRTAISAADFAESVGGQLSTFTTPCLVRLPLAHNTNNPTAMVWRFSFNCTSTGWDEKFLIGIPRKPLRPAAPLLVLWHSQSRTEKETWVDTDFFEEATSRGWYVIAPLAAHQFHKGIEYAQRNTEELIAFMDKYLLASGSVGFDKERIYAAGFSMGGSVVAYGCRHLDPTEFPYAAIFNLSGEMSAAYKWQDLPPPPFTNPIQPGTELRNHPLMFGGSPNHPKLSFFYQIASNIHLWPRPFIVDESCDLLRNIPEINVYNAYAFGDPVETAIQTNLASKWAATAHAGCANSYFTFREFGPDLTLPLHSWDQIHYHATFNEKWILSWFYGKTFKRPKGYARILADRDVRYYDISVTQDPSLVAASPSGGILSPFEFDVSAVAMPANTLWLKSSQETAALEIHSADMGLQTRPGALLTLNLDGVTPTPVKIILNDYSAAPSTVQRQIAPSLPVTIPINTPSPAGASWTFSGGQVVITEPDPGSAPVWTFQ